MAQLRRANEHLQAQILELLSKTTSDAVSTDANPRSRKLPLRPDNSAHKEGEAEAGVGTLVARASASVESHARVKRVACDIATQSPASCSDDSLSATVRLRALFRLRERERAFLAAERANLEFICDQDYLEKLKRQQDRKKQRKTRQRIRLQANFKCKYPCLTLVFKKGRLHMPSSKTPHNAVDIA
eukprot:4845527-Pleurochrysis_carterae.AAC.2